MKNLYQKPENAKEAITQISRIVVEIKKANPPYLTWRAALNDFTRDAPKSWYVENKNGKRLPAYIQKVIDKLGREYLEVDNINKKI